MPTTSLVVTATDRYSDTVKKMTAVTRAFSKDVDGLESRLYALNKNRYALQLDAEEAKLALQAAEAQFTATRSEADGLKMDLARANYDGIVRNLNTVTAAAEDTEQAISKTMNKSSGGKTGVLNALAASGALNAGRQFFVEASDTFVGSILGEEGGTLASSILSNAFTGLVAGAMMGDPYAAVSV